MAIIVSDSGIAIRGKQRIAVYRALKQPATGRQILDKSRECAPSMTYQDLRHILRDFQHKGIAVCLNPECQTGRFYALASKDKVSFAMIEKVDLCARIGRAKTRLAVLKEVAKERFFEARPLTATQIKKYMRDTYPLGLNHVSAALKFLEGHGLVEVDGFTDKRDLKTYRITDLGITMLNQIFGGSPTR